MPISLPHPTGGDHLHLIPVPPAASAEKRGPSSDGHTASMEKVQETFAESVRDADTAQSCHHPPGNSVCIYTCIYELHLVMR